MVVCTGHYSHWAAEIFGECVTDTREWISLIVGLSSIGFWLLAQFPQLVVNYRRQNSDALSALFLLQWLIGDSSNLVGALLTHQLQTQIFAAVYFCLMDIALCSQYLYYERKVRKRLELQKGFDVEDGIDDESQVGLMTGQESSSSSDDDNDGAQDNVCDDYDESFLRESDSSINGNYLVKKKNNKKKNKKNQKQKKVSGAGDGKTLLMMVMFPLFIVFFTGASFFYSSSSIAGENNQFTTEVIGMKSAASFVGRKLMGIHSFGNKRNFYGMVIGWFSAFFYLGSRLPQIMKNYRRQSVEGLSFGMFVCAVMGNVTYSTAIFVLAKSWDYIYAKLPWIIGSVGTLCFDFTIFLQFLYYGKALPKDKRLIE